MDEHLKNEILSSLELEGAASLEEKSIQLIIANRLQADKLIDKSSGLSRFRSSALKNFQLILGQPLSLRILNPLTIRCCLCGKAINYPCWYFSQKLLINWFNYFVCFDALSPSKPSTKCMKRG